MFYDERLQEVGARIKKCRKDLGFTQKQLLEKCYLSPDSVKTIRCWESGKRLPDMDTLARMCDIFDCDFGYLTGDFPTKRRETSEAAEVTGLSTTAIERLESYTHYDTMTGKLRLKVLDLLLCNTDFSVWMLSWISAYFDKYAAYRSVDKKLALERQKQSEATTPEDKKRLSTEVRKLQKQLTSARDSAEVTLWRIERDFTKIVEDIVQEQYKRNEEV